MKKTNYIDYNQYKEHLTYLMGGTSDQQNQYIFDLGLKWLDNYFNPYSEYTKLYSEWWSKSKHFWDWFKFEYNIKCYETVVSMGFDLNIINITKFQRQALIECFHDINKKFLNIYPGMPIMAKIEDEIKEVRYA